MKTYRGDIHIHTHLSPCGSLDMSPTQIIATALKQQLDFIAICDHNTTHQAQVIKQMAKTKGLPVFLGVELNSKEEVHCLALFEDTRQYSKIQNYIEEHLPHIPNNPDYFGYQVAVDRDENIVYTEELMLHSALDVGINQLCHKVHQLGGLFIPAHINRKGNGIISQLGFIPSDLNYDALEVHRMADTETIRQLHNIPSNVSLIKNSDAHYPENIGQAYTEYQMNELSFEQWRKAIRTNQVRSRMASK